MAKKFFKRRAKPSDEGAGQSIQEEIKQTQEKIENHVNEVLDEAFDGVRVTTRKERAKAIKEELEKELNPYQKFLMDSLISSTKKTFSKMSSETTKAFGELKGAEVSIEMNRHVRRVVKMIEDSFIYGLGESQDNISDVVAQMNAEFTQKMIDSLSIDMAAGDIYTGPQSEKEVDEFNLVISDAYERLNDLTIELSEAENLSDEMANKIAELMDLTEGAYTPEVIFKEIQRFFEKNKNIKQEQPEVEKILKNIIENYKSFSSVNIEEEVEQMQELRREQDRVHSLLSFNMGAFVSGIKNIVTSFISTIDSIKESEKKLYAIAAISDMSAPQIEVFRNQMMQFAAETPFAAATLTQAYGELVRTGKTAQEAMQILRGVSELAIASFEPLEKVASSVNSLMLAMEMSADRAKEVSSSLFSVLNATPLGFESLNAALTQTGAAFNAVISQTSKTGEELDNYKMAMTDLQASMIGGMSLLGKTGSQAGTAIRNMTTRLASMEEAAKKALQLDLDLKGGFTSGDVSIRTAEDLSALAQEDFGKVTEILSQMTKQGVLSFDTLRKLFTGRNVTQIVGVLTQIDGNIDSFVKSMTGNSEALEKAHKVASRSWVQQYDQFKQMMGDLSTYAGSAMDIVAPLLVAVNSVGSSIAKMSAESTIANASLNAVGTALGIFGASVGAVQTSIAISSVATKLGIKSLTSFSSLLSALVGTFKTVMISGGFVVPIMMAVGAAFAAWYTIVKRHKAAQDSLNSAIEKNIQADKNRLTALQNSDKVLSGVTKELQDVRVPRIGEDISKTIGVMTYGMEDSVSAISSLTQSLMTFVSVVNTAKDTLDKYSSATTEEDKARIYFAEKKKKATTEAEEQRIAKEEKSALAGMELAKSSKVKEKIKTLEARGISTKEGASEVEQAKLLQLVGEMATKFAKAGKTSDISESEVNSIMMLDEVAGEKIREIVDRYTKLKDAMREANQKYASAKSEDKEKINSERKSIFAEFTAAQEDISSLASVYPKFSTKELGNLEKAVNISGEISKETLGAQKSIIESQTQISSKALSNFKKIGELYDKEILDSIDIYKTTDYESLSKKIKEDMSIVPELQKRTQSMLEKYVKSVGQENVSGAGFEKFIKQYGRNLELFQSGDAAFLAISKNSDTKIYQDEIDRRVEEIKSIGSNAELFGQAIIPNDVLDLLDEYEEEISKLSSKKIKTDEEKKKLSDIQEKREKLAISTYASISFDLAELGKITTGISEGVIKSAIESAKDEILSFDDFETDDKKLGKKEKAIKNVAMKISEGGGFDAYFENVITHAKRLEKEVAEIVSKGGSEEDRKKKVEEIQEILGPLAAVDSRVSMIAKSLLGLLIQIPDEINDKLKGKVKIDMKLTSVRIQELMNEIDGTIASMLPDSPEKFRIQSKVQNKSDLLSEFSKFESFVAGKVNDETLGKDSYEKIVAEVAEAMSFERIAIEYDKLLKQYKDSDKMSSSDKKQLEDSIAELRNRQNKIISDYISNDYNKAISTIDKILSSTPSYSAEVSALVSSQKNAQEKIIRSLGLSKNDEDAMIDALNKNIEKARKDAFRRMTLEFDTDRVMGYLDEGRPDLARGHIGEMSERVFDATSSIDMQKAEYSQQEALLEEKKEALKNLKKGTKEYGEIELQILEMTDAMKKKQDKIYSLTQDRDDLELDLVMLQIEVSKRNGARLKELYGQLESEYANMFMTMFGYGSAKELSVESALGQLSGGLGSSMAKMQSEMFQRDSQVSALQNMTPEQFASQYGLEGKTKQEIESARATEIGKVESKADERLNEIMSNGLQQIAAGLLNLARASKVEKALSRIEKKMSDIDTRQKDIDRRRQVADDIQEKAALFNEEQLLEEERIRLEIEMSSLQQQELMMAQTEQLVNIWNEIALLRADSQAARGEATTTGSKQPFSVESLVGDIMGSSKQALSDFASDISIENLKNLGSDLLGSAGDVLSGAVGGLGNMAANALVTKWTGDAALGQMAGGITQGLTGLATGNVMDMISGTMDAVKGLTTGLFGDKKAEKEISKKINEHNKKIAEAVKDFNFQSMMYQLESINSGIRMVSENVVKYGLRGSYQMYTSQVGGNLSGAGAAEYVSHTESYGGSWIRRRRRKDVMGAVTETMDLRKIGELLGGDYKEALGDYRIDSMDEMKLALEGAKKIQQGISDWQKQNAGMSGAKGESGRLWAQSQAAMDATNQILAKLEEVQRIYAENLDKFNSQLFGFTVEFIDEFGNIADSTEEIKDVIVTEWSHLSNILESISSNMFQELSTLGDSIYSAIFDGVAQSLSKSDTMVELGGELSKLVYELSQKFLPEGTDINLVGSRTQEQIFSDILGVMNSMKEEEQKLKDFAQMVSERMLALGGDIKELRPYLSIDFQTADTQISHYQEKFNEAFQEIKTDLYNAFMKGGPIEVSEKNLAEFNQALDDYIKSQQAAKDMTDYITDEFTNKFISGEISYPFEDVSEYLNKEFVEMRDMVTEFFNAEDFSSAVSNFGSSIGKKITDNIITKMLDTSKYKTALNDIYKNVDAIMNKGTSVSFKELAQLAQDTQKYGIMLDQERQKIQAMRDLFDFNSEVVYDTTQDTINYQTSSSKESVYNIYQTNNFDIGNFVSTRASMEEFSDMVAPYMAKAFNNLGLN